MHANSIRDTAVTEPTCITTGRATDGQPVRKTCAWPHHCTCVLNEYNYGHMQF